MPDRHVHDVCVIGAGLAGLTATDVLRRAGVDVVLVEAERPGGRVRTVREPFTGSQHAELGGEWVDNVHERMLALLDRFGLALERTGERWSQLRRWTMIDGHLHSPDELHGREPGLRDELERLERIVHAAAEGIADASRPDLHPDARSIDALSMADAIRDAELGPLAAWCVARDSQGEFAAEPHDVSLLFVAQQRALYTAAEATLGAPATAHRVIGGLGRIVDALADESAGVLQTGRRLRALAITEDAVEATFDDGTGIAARHVVLACSLVALRSVGISPALTDDVRGAVDLLGYGAVTKTAIQYAERRWSGGYAMTTDVTQRSYEPTRDQPGRAGILTSYTGGDDGRRLASLPTGERIGLAARDQRRVHPGIGEGAIAISEAWSANEGFGGSYSCYGPGQVTAYWAALRRPHGRIHLAGEHAATWTGYMEGAVESGAAVAGRLLHLI